MGHSQSVNTISLLTQIISAVTNGQGPAYDPNFGGTFVSGDFRLDLRRRLVFKGDKQVSLTPREYDLLLALAWHDGAAVSKTVMLAEVWQNRVAPESRTITQHIAELRRKLERDPARPECILTVSKFGYRIVGQWVEDTPAAKAHSLSIEAR